MTEVTRTPSSFPAASSPVASQNTLERLEYHRALELVAERAVSALGRARVLARVPVADLPWVAGELAEVGELADLIGQGDPFRPAPVSDLSETLRLLRVPGSVLEPKALMLLAAGVEAMHHVESEVGRVAEGAPRLSRRLVELPPMELGRRLGAPFDPDGQVRDGVVPEVDRARRRVREARAALVALLERLLPAGGSITVRGGRYVIPVARDSRSRVPGIVHGESGSGQTLFVEPQQAVELGNEVARAEADETRAIRRLLSDLTESARPHADSIAAGLEMAVAVDDVYARARYAADVRAPVPGLTDAPGPHILKQVRHPLLLAEGVDAVPFDLELDREELAVVVSGPNTGGKTVLLKAVGLVNALAQAGVIPPAGEGTVLPVLERLFADIGDHQSIAASLSTFSAHLVTLREVLTQAGPASLVLVDEIGSGTDPVEGAALAEAVIMALVTRGVRVVATTHLGALKRLAAETPGVVNASLEFDSTTLAPTYRLHKGVPGRSYGLVIARRLGLPHEVLNAAEARTPKEELALDAMLAELEERSRRLAALEEELAVREDTVAAREARNAAREQELAEQDAALKKRSRELEREGREQARRFLLDARKRVEEALGVARAAVSEATAKEARRLVEEGITEEARALQDLREQLRAKGWTVRGETEPSGTPPGPPLTAHRSRLPSHVSPVTEIDLRGMVSDDAISAVDRAIDDAVLADLPALRVIHGKGTGALRAAVSDALKGDSRVASFRLAPPNEGGTGVTIVELA